MASQGLKRDVELARAIAREVERRGGRAYYVGGYVRDRLLGLGSKDVDMEVHGIPAEELMGLLSGFGRPSEHGASFGVLNVGGYDLDICLPEPGVGVREAARRRDLTINAFYEDILTGEVLDFFGGRDDLSRGVARHVDANTFAQDPLRVLRVAQFAARFGMRVDEGTRELCSGLDISDVAAERVLEELRKALLKSERPSIFFEELRKMGQLRPWFVELADLEGVEQNPLYHPEGDVWAHTMLVVDAAAQDREQASEPFAFMLSALLHDVGKPQATKTLDGGRIVSYGHEKAGVPVAAAFLNRVGTSGKVRSYVLNMVELHMRPLSLLAQGGRPKSFNRMFDRSCCPRDLVLLSCADDRGRAGKLADDAPRMELEKRLAVFEEMMAKPYVQGRDLIELGVEPGPLMGEVLAHAHKLRLAGVSKDEALRHCWGYYTSAREKAGR